MEYYESPAYGEFCKQIYGSDLKQMGMVTHDELELFFREIDLPPHSHILDMGCGSGYMSAVVAERLNSHVTGIDIDEQTIAFAKKTFENNNSLDFQLLDYNEIAFKENTFDLIYFFDTLYFTLSIEKLRFLLDKCYKILKPGAKLAVFWSNHPNMYEMKEPCADNTQVGIWGNDNNIQVKSFDLTDPHRLFWQKALAENLNMENELRTEIPEIFENLLKERTYFDDLCKKGDDGGIYRWLYIFSKSDKQ